MNIYKQVKHRLSKEEQEGMASLLAKLKEKRELAIKAGQEVRDNEEHRTAQ